MRKGSTTAAPSERGGAAGRAGSSAQTVSPIEARNRTPSRANTTGQGSHCAAKMASAPATSMPMRYHMTRSPLAGPCSAGSSTSTAYASRAMSCVADQKVMKRAMSPAVVAAPAASDCRPVAGS